MSNSTLMTLGELLVHVDSVVRRHALGIVKRLAVLVATKLNKTVIHTCSNCGLEKTVVALEGEGGEPVYMCDDCLGNNAYETDAEPKVEPPVEDEK